MLSPFSCGTFSNQEDYDIDELLSPCATPKRSRKPSKENKNPYADRGLDKFSALLAELEGKKQKIYTQKGSADISFVRFVYSSSNNWRPIVVKSKDRKQDNTSTGHVQNAKDKQQITQNSEEDNTIEASSAVKAGQNEELSGQAPKKKSIVWGEFDQLMKNLKHPYYHLPMVMLLILLLLAVYGRSFAILCTSLGWYLVPMIKERSTSSGNSSSTTTPDKTKNKKDYTRRLSEKSVASSSSTVIASDKTKNKKDYTRRSSEKNMGSNNIIIDRSSPPRSPRPSSSPKSVLTRPGEKPNGGGRHSHKNSW